MVRGSLIYLPSESILTNGDNPTSLRKLKSPGVFLVVSDTERCYNIMYEGAKWLVDKKSSYEVQEEINYDN
jgi:hypothetical protein